jgi:hypothetical protein
VVLGLPEGDAEIVLTTNHGHNLDWLVASAGEAVERVRARGKGAEGDVDIPVGRVAVVADPFENVLVLLDMSKGSYTTDESGDVRSLAARGYSTRTSIHGNWRSARLVIQGESTREEPVPQCDGRFEWNRAYPDRRGGRVVRRPDQTASW